MKKTLIAIISLALLSSAALAKGRHSRAKGDKPKATRPIKVKGYTKKNGVYVAPSVRTEPNKTKLDNYSSKGNANPATGKAGTVDPLKP